jgi:hypothetical protein
LSWLRIFCLFDSCSQPPVRLLPFAGIIAAMRFAAVLMFTAGVLAAQPSAFQDWGNVKRLAPGEKIRVSMSDGKSYQGDLRSAADDSVVVVTASGEQSIPRAGVAKLATKHPGHRARNTLIGLGVGAGVGLGFGAGVDSGCSHDCFLGNNIGKAIFTPLGAIAGTVVGVLWPTGGWKDVYRTK